MGTNYYAKHIPTEKEYAEMQEALANKQLKDLRELIDKATAKYHIGKRSCGWAFCFQAAEEPKRYYVNNEADVPWEDNLESLKEYLLRDDVQIIDEYGEELTPEQFWNEEVGESLYVHDTKDRSYDSHESYHRKKGELHYKDSHEVVKNGIRWTYCWFS